MPTASPLSRFQKLLSFLDIKRCHRIGTSPANIFFPVLWVTNKCNLRCRMCDQWKTDPYLLDRELATEQWLPIIDSTIRMRAMVIVITGGEPLLRRDVFEIIKHIRKNDVACHLCSNGTLLNPEVVFNLQRSGLNSISVSLDSDVAQIHNQVRGTDCFNTVVDGIRILSKRAPEIKLGINCVISKQNFRNLHRLIPFAESLGAKQIKFDVIHCNLMHKAKPRESFNELIFNKSDLFELAGEIKKIISSVRNSRLLTSPPIFLEGILKHYTDKPYKFPCYAGYISCAVDAFGKVSPCEEFEGVDTIEEGSFEKAWKSGAFQALRKKVKSCSCACWDTTHAEINLRCHGFRFIREIPRILREIKFYGR